MPTIASPSSTLAMNAPARPTHPARIAALAAIDSWADSSVRVDTGAPTQPWYSEDDGGPVVVRRPRTLNGTIPDQCPRPVHDRRFCEHRECRSGQRRLLQLGRTAVVFRSGEIEVEPSVDGFKAGL